MTEPESCQERRWRPSPLILLSAGLHAAGAVSLASAVASWSQVAAALAANHAVLGTAGMWPRSRLLGPNLTCLPQTATFENRVALTFDDGPDPEVTPRVLDLLDAHCARATFFVIGRRADQHPGIVAEMVRRGHRVENHSYGHAHTLAFFGPRALARDIDRAQESLKRASGRRPVLFRAPAGIRNPWFEPVLASRGLSLVSWTRRGYDAVDRQADRVTRRLLKGLAAGDVLLLHDGSAAHDRNGCPVVLQALQRLLDAMAERGLSSIHLPTPRSEGTDRTFRDSSGT